MSDTDGLNLNTAAFDAAVVRLAMTSKKAAVEVMRDQARLLFVQVAKITPPASAGVAGRKAEKQGQAAVARDIRSLYGTASDAYDQIAARSPAQAGAFWFLHSAGYDTRAADIVKTATGKSFSPFDGGALHNRTGGGRRRRSKARREHVFFVSNPQSLESYIQQEQSHVWWLASGWAPALRALAAKLPYGTGKLAAPGRLRVEVTDQRIAITMTNEVSFGRGVKDIERRIQAALGYRVSALDRRWETYINRAGKSAGFTVK